MYTEGMKLVQKYEAEEAELSAKLKVREASVQPGTAT
jgi:hypothetical protein